ncbi:hypothetical protein BDW22DRAFT_1336775 [Trametopsis cervina]|nr:hypothetical protein BDW22DRAFT_1336775 [Trametopsis cervina]
MRLARSLTALSLLFFHGVLAANFTLVKEYSGGTFFDDWIFDEYSYDNTTGGSVNYVTKANSSSLAYVNDATNRVIIKVDNTSFVPYNFKRNSVRIATKDFFSIGTVWLIDAVHIPFGCSVWPSIWTKGNAWPDNGEIDIIEGVNRNPLNQMALHTNHGCFATTKTNALNQPTITDCNSTDNSGCTVPESTPNSFGQLFANNGGGVWATQFDVSGIFIWFWGRSHVPPSVTTATDSLDISSWGPPSAAYVSSSCNIPDFFGAQQIVIDITLCGIWAGNPALYAAQCGGNATDPSTCVSHVVWYNGTSDYANAYFELNSIRAFSVNSTPVVDSNGSSASAGAPSTSPTSSGPGSGGSGSGTIDTSEGVALSPRGLYAATIALCFIAAILM